MADSSVKRVGSKFILGPENRMREAVNVPLDLVRIAPHELSHCRHGVLEAFPFFGAAIRHHSDDTVLRAQFWTHVKSVGIDSVLHHGDCFTEAAAELASQPSRVGDSVNRHLESIAAQHLDQWIPLQARGRIGIRSKKYFVVVLREMYCFAFPGLPGGNDAFPVSGDD